jgi:hypothetical protein
MGRTEPVSSSPAVLCFHTLGCSDFVVKGNSVPEINIDLILWEKEKPTESKWPTRHPGLIQDRI